MPTLWKRAFFTERRPPDPGQWGLVYFLCSVFYPKALRWEPNSFLPQDLCTCCSCAWKTLLKHLSLPKSVGTRWMLLTRKAFLSPPPGYIWFLNISHKLQFSHATLESQCWINKTEGEACPFHFISFGKPPLKFRVDHWANASAILHGLSALDPEALTWQCHFSEHATRRTHLLLSNFEPGQWKLQTPSWLAGIIARLLPTDYHKWATVILKSESKGWWDRNSV
jgi:hypothetical protein